MSTSDHDGVYLFDVAEFGSDRFVDTALVRDAIVNGANHKADSAAQPRAAWTAPASALWTDEGNPWLEPADSLLGGGMTVGVWSIFPVFATFAPKVRASGAGYRLRVTLGGRSSAGHSVDFGVFVSTRRDVIAAQTTATPGKEYSAVTSTTVAMLTADDTTRWVDVPRSLIDRASRGSSFSTLLDTGGTPVSVDVPTIDVWVAGKTANVASKPELHLFGCAEVIGT